MTKRFYRSKTFWFNAVTLVGAILLALSKEPIISDSPEVMAWILAGFAASNVVLRFVTGTTIKLLVIAAACLSTPAAMAQGL